MRLPALLLGLVAALPEIGLPVTGVWLLRSRGDRTHRPWPLPLIGAALGCLLLLVTALHPASDLLVAGLWAPVLVWACFLAGAVFADRTQAPYRPAVILGITLMALFVGALILATQGEHLTLLVNHENTLAARLAVLAMIAAIFVATPGMRLLLFLSGVAISILSGSRAALFGLVLFFLVITAAGGSSRRGSRSLLQPAIGITILALILSIGPWRSHFAAALPWNWLPESSRNLVRASEEMSSDSWTARGVSVERREGSPSEPAVHMISKDSNTSSARLIAAVHPVTDAVYFVSARLRPVTEGSEPGIHLWVGSNEGSNGVAWLAAGSQDVTVQSRGNIEILEHDLVLQDDGWMKVSFAVRISHATGSLLVGLSPDLTGSRVGTAALVSEVQVSERALDDYHPTYSTSPSVRSVQGRWRIFRQAWTGFESAPIVGNGTGSFANNNAYGHAHNLFLHLLYEQGLVGLLGLVILLLAFCGVPGSMSVEAVSLVVAVVALNMFDYTFWTAGVCLPLAFVCGLLARRNAPPRVTARVP